MKRVLNSIRVAMALILTTLPAQAEILSLKSMKDVQAKVEVVLKSQKPEDVLVAFDIDMTLTQPDHPAIFYPALKKYSDIYKKIMGDLTPEQKDLASTLTTQLFPQRLVEKETPHIIKSLEQKNIKVIAFTASLAGPIKGYKDKMVIRRRNQLQKLGLNFTNSLNSFVKVKSFFDFKSYAGSHPTFYQGVLSTNGEGGTSKGDVLVALLCCLFPDKANKPTYSPKIVLLIDDKKKHLENVEASLKAYDPSIQFIGINYKGAFSYAPQSISKVEFKKFWEDMANRAKLLSSRD